jgi:hypothetical protein
MTTINPTVANALAGLSEGLMALFASLSQSDARPIWVRIPSGSADDNGVISKCPHSGLSRSALLKLVADGELEAKSMRLAERSKRTCVIVRLRSESAGDLSIDAFISRQPALRAGAVADEDVD